MDFRAIGKEMCDKFGMRLLCLLVQPCCKAQY